MEPRQPAGELYDWLEKELLALVNTATGMPVIRRILRGDILFEGPFRNDFPDLVIEWNSDAPIPAVRSPRIGELPVESLNSRTGDHRPQGLVLVRSRELKASTLEDEIPLVSLAPTLAARLGVEVSGIDGKPIPAFLAEQTTARVHNEA
ncbi:MAG TPA: hypothetical protein VJ746_10290 [Nitrospira sp.]|nr:hypothetical protein [Nitrospira sp.]